MHTSPVSTVQRHPWHTDLLAAAAHAILERWHEHLPDLSRLNVILPQPLAASDLRRRLLAALPAGGPGSLLGPRLLTLSDYLDTHLDAPQPVWSREAGLLALVEALRGHEALFGDEDTWRLAEHLLELFQELTLNRVELADADGFHRRLGQAYRIAGRPPPALEREAGIVHRLWRAWHEQLAALRVEDPARARLQCLIQAAVPAAGELGLVLVGEPELNSAERAWLAQRLQHPDCLWLRQDGNTALDALCPGIDIVADPTPPAARCLDSIYADTGTAPELRRRALEFAAAHPASPLQGQLAVFGADSAEQEARAIELRIRQWLLEGRRRLGIVTEDRRLARRVRALLERAGVTLNDTGGWALSTTSAATVVERWLESVEQDFEHRPLLDFLKSPFASGADREQHLLQVYRLEQDVILQGRIARGIPRYRRQLGTRQELLGDWPAAEYQGLFALLDRLESAAAGLRECLTGRHPAERLLQALRDSLDELGVWRALEQDPAGERILRVWERLHSAVNLTPLELDWTEFRTWFGRSLETAHFTPPGTGGPVRLLSLEQSQGLRFDGLILAACDARHLPGGPPTGPFFNDRVRRELGLPVWRERLDRRFALFRCLLGAAGQVLLTHRREDQGEPVLPSPWLELLQGFHRLAWNDDLEDTGLAAALDQPASRVRPAAPPPLPEPPDRPRPILPAGLRPPRVSASSHQRLIDCPYAWFAADGLGLKPPEAIREALQKQDYGERVHRCLEAFHGRVRGLPGPFAETLTEANREAATALLNRISEAVFARDLEDNFQHRGWLKRWQVRIPEYIDWQIRQARGWQVESVEQRIERTLDPELTLRGRLDRIDRGAEGLAILDYKTGYTPDQEQVEAGEAVQLPFYRLLLDQPVRRSSYLPLDDRGRKIQDRIALETEDLDHLSRAVQARLETVTAEIDAGAGLPAWGDEATCRRCDLDGLCRKAVWDE
ncbi:DNA helicase/exodeoxyribonuclease V, subunit B [Thiohalobacter thiocyanaticus]|uniref:DNA helicase/exodeoxyribonuclease V, subunit B n=1 Tax=Thiohalobacter thiocyanaticus TaxID=585455 RepID=A0A1Z4VT51_9GAMM|nr:PD-(D/E)XK nuclease family protein [Thiohalobacter thiocyanaticus]BAZ94811.1 DNA helicase/exodeoxyribonuclease V, subunit B [Thiohalobacter thiocyanaticus]